MRGKGILILSAITLVLLLSVYLFEIRKPREDQLERKQLGKIIGLSPEQVSKFEIVYAEKNDRLSYERDKEGKWVPSRQGAQKGNDVDNLLSRAMKRTIHSTVQQEGGLNEYGLDKPRITVSFFLSDGTLKRVLLGREVPIGNYVYVKEASSPDIYTISSAIVRDFTEIAEEKKGSKGET